MCQYTNGTESNSCLPDLMDRDNWLENLESFEVWNESNELKQTYEFWDKLHIRPDEIEDWSHYAWLSEFEYDHPGCEPTEWRADCTAFDPEAATECQVHYFYSECAPHTCEVIEDEVRDCLPDLLDADAWQVYRNATIFGDEDKAATY